MDALVMPASASYHKEVNGLWLSASTRSTPGKPNEWYIIAGLSGGAICRGICAGARSSMDKLAVTSGSAVKGSSCLEPGRASGISGSPVMAYQGSQWAKRGRKDL